MISAGQAMQLRAIRAMNCELGATTKASLSRWGATLTLGDLYGMSDGVLLRQPRFGQKALREVRAAIDAVLNPPARTYTQAEVDSILKAAFPLSADRAADQFLAEVRAELTRARALFPGDRIMGLAMVEEAGELVKAMLDEPAAAVRKEAVQTAVMAARIALDGDGSVREWRAAKGLDPLVQQVEAPRDEWEGICSTCDGLTGHARGHRPGCPEATGEPDALSHRIYTDADADRPDVICDANRSVVLGLCKVCGLGEAELDEHPICPGSPEAGRALRVEAVSHG